MKKIILSLLLTVVLISGESRDLSVEPFIIENETVLTDDELKKRVLYTGLASGAAVMLWGAAFWDYTFDTSRMVNEGWFEEDTKYGGADKLGHVYATYLWSTGFSYLYEGWGMSEDDAMIYAPLSSWFLQLMMEVGDSSSETLGFSYEDVVMNTVGATFYYLREKYPKIKETLDLRIEFIPEFKGDMNFFTQYNSMKYLLAFKFSGIESMDSTLLKYGELQLGYYTRGYKNASDYTQKERITYVGIGINISEVLAEMGWIKTSKIFNYYQLPYTYVPFGYDIDTSSYVSPYSRPYRGYSQ